MIRTRIEEIAEDLWANHRVMQVPSGEARWLEVGHAVVAEQWSCHQNHGDGVCGEPLVPYQVAKELLGCPEDPTFPEDEFKRELIPFDHLDPIWGFNASELIHFSDVRAMHGVYGEPFNTPDGIIEWRYPDEGAQG
ncbi:hypothetical protein SAV14893_050910 [Streptomyces avermitilis]|uniref:Uncharacterized protein n=1 Tax=Streptomyces avermitilis TaxID=33903 RepID=A0A4D4M1A4_STRAX|nr:hypothetical protein SAV14893_050910 [Streptomyces avermitilis]